MKKYIPVLLLLITLTTVFAACRKNDTANNPVTSAKAPGAAGAEETETSLVPPNWIDWVTFNCPLGWQRITYKPTYSWWVNNFTQHRVYIRRANVSVPWMDAGLSTNNGDGTFTRIFGFSLLQGTYWMFFTSPNEGAPGMDYTPLNCNCVKAFNVVPCK
jgi:hypothetical protein